MQQQEPAMPTLRNPVLDRLRKDELALGVGIRLARSVEIAKMMRGCDFDWLFIDLEHGPLTLDQVAQMSAMAMEAGIGAIVRVPHAQWDMASRALDNGATGIVIPHIETVEVAATAVQRLRFPPVGHRATYGGIAQYDYGPVEVVEVAAALDATILLAMMLESPRGIENAEAIAALPGIDVLFIGAHDLSVEMGVPGQLDHPRMVAAFERVVAAAKKHGKFCGFGGVADEALIGRYIGLGMRMIQNGTDFAFMIKAATDRAKALRRVHR
jgi:2-keto-3-deoxy-L-rhamnonate aldolase RhmA